MDTSTIIQILPTIFLWFVVACLGASVGALIQRRLDRRAPPKAVQAPLPVPPIPNQLNAEGDVEILRAWRTLAGKLWLEMDAARLDGKESLQADQRRRLMSMLTDLRPWLENPPPAAAAELKPGPVIGLDQPLIKAKPNVKEVKPVVELKSIVEQIDDVLQARLLTSSLKNRDLHLTEGPGGVVLVRDGLNCYEGIDAVPEPEIQAFIRQAVSEWEKSSR
jgi:hypothetical protein